MKEYKMISEKISKMNYTKRLTPRWIIFIIDLGICFSSLLIAFYLRFNLSIPALYISKLLPILLCILAIRAVSFLIAHTSSGIIRYTCLRDIELILTVVASGSLTFVAINVVNMFFLDGKNIIPYSVIIIDFVTTSFLMICFRLLTKTLYYEFMHPSKEKTNMIIYGTGEFAMLTKRALDLDNLAQYKVVAFIENSKRNVKKTLEGIPIYYLKDLSLVVSKYNATHLIIAKKNIPNVLKNDLVEKCLNLDIKVLTVPNVKQWINGELSVRQLKNIKIEDLLERDAIHLDDKQVRKQNMGKVIMVTGAAGSIGSEIVRQLTSYNPQKIILLDQAESPLYDIDLEISEKFNFHDYEIILADVTDMGRMNEIFAKYKPDIIYHAAAYKHVPMMEINPIEAVHNNVLGTKLIADLAVKYKASKFVMISTDKAVNPTNVMGASKRIAEIYTQSLNSNCSTNFITTRFGNVLGSNGSVIPRFKKQIENGGPVTVTDPNVTRFFMTISEACHLVLEAGAMGEGGEIYIFDMGRSVKIVDMAKKMIKLSGLEIGKDIHLKFTGLRPGEKLYEELLNARENTIPTYHPKIMIAKVIKYDFEKVCSHIEDLKISLKDQNNFESVRIMKEIVPEFKSQNSVYERLDLEINNTYNKTTSLN